MAVVEPGRRDPPRPGPAPARGVPPRARPRPRRRGGRRPARPGRPAAVVRRADRRPSARRSSRPWPRPTATGSPSSLARRRDRRSSRTPRSGSSTWASSRDRPDLLARRPARSERAAEAVGRRPRPRPGRPSSRGSPTTSSRPTRRRLKERIKTLNWELFDRAVGAADLGGPRGADEAGRASGSSPSRDATPEELQALRAALEKPFADRLLLWQKTKNDLVEEMGTALQMPGWGTSSPSRSPTGSRCSRPASGCRSA